MSSLPVKHVSVVPVTQSLFSGRKRRPPRRPLMGLVTASNEAPVVGTMTSGGTDVIEISASTSRSTTGAAVDVGGDTVSSGATVVGALVEATDDTVETGAPDEVGATAGVVVREAHAVARSTKATRQRAAPSKGFDLTTLTTRARYCRWLSYRTRGSIPTCWARVRRHAEGVPAHASGRSSVVWNAGPVTVYKIRFEGPAALAIHVATELADADGVELTSSARPAILGENTVELNFSVEGAHDAVATAVSTISEELPEGASIELAEG